MKTKYTLTIRSKNGNITRHEVITDSPIGDVFYALARDTHLLVDVDSEEVEDES